jgi:hypothetical protein
MMRQVAEIGSASVPVGPASAMIPVGTAWAAVPIGMASAAVPVDFVKIITGSGADELDFAAIVAPLVNGDRLAGSASVLIADLGAAERPRIPVTYLPKKPAIFFNRNKVAAAVVAHGEFEIARIDDSAATFYACAHAASPFRRSNRHIQFTYELRIARV